MTLPSHRLLFAVVLWVTASAAALLAQISSPLGRNLTVPEYFENAGQPGMGTNYLKGRLKLQQVEYLPNRLIYGRTMQLEQYSPEGRTNVIARAPECYFNETNRTASSTGRLEIIAMDGRVLITGHQGFEVSLTNTVLLLSNRVRTVLRQNLLNP